MKLLAIILLLTILVGCDKLDESDLYIPEPTYPSCRIEFTNVRVIQGFEPFYKFRFRVGILDSLNRLITNYSNKDHFAIPDPVWDTVYNKYGYSGFCSYSFDLVHKDIAIQIKPINSYSGLYSFTLKVYIEGKLEKVVESMDGEIEFYSYIKMRNNY